MLNFAWVEWSRKIAAGRVRQMQGNRRVARNQTAVLERLEDRCLLSAGKDDKKNPNAAQVSWSNTSATVAEGNTGPVTLPLTIIATNLANVKKDITVKGVVEFSGIGQGFASRSDFPSIPFTATIKKGETSAVVNVAINGDTLIEGNEKFFVRMVNASGARIINAVQEVTITDDDTLPTGQIGVTLVPGKQQGSVEGTQVPYTLHLTAASPVPLDVTIVLTGAGDKGKNDKSPASIPGDATVNGLTQTVVTIPKDTIDFVFNVSLVDDTEPEKREGYAVTITPATSSLVTDGITSVQGVIIDNDQPPKVSIASKTKVVEGNLGTTSAEVVVTLDRVATADVVINFSTSTPKSNNGNGNGNGKGKGGDNGNGKGKGKDKHKNRADALDFTPVKNGTVTIPAGQTSAKILIGILGDTTVENDESFEVKLQSVSSKNAKINQNSDQGEVVITNDDTATK